MGRGALLDFAHGEPRRARCDDHVGRQQLVELPIELLLEIDPLGPVLLDEVGAGERLREVGRELQVRLRRARRQAQSLERRPGGLDEFPQRGFCVRCDVGRDDLQSLGEIQRGPAGADHASANNGNRRMGLFFDMSLLLRNFGVCDAGEVTLCFEEISFAGSIEPCGVDRAARNRSRTCGRLERRARYRSPP